MTDNLYWNISHALSYWIFIITLWSGCSLYSFFTDEAQRGWMLGKAKLCGNLVCFQSASIIVRGSVQVLLPRWTCSGWGPKHSGRGHDDTLRTSPGPLSLAQSTCCGSSTHLLHVEQRWWGSPHSSGLGNSLLLLGSLLQLDLLAVDSPFKTNSGLYFHFSLFPPGWFWI